MTNPPPPPSSLSSSKSQCNSIPRGGDGGGCGGMSRASQKRAKKKKQKQENKNPPPPMNSQQHPDALQPPPPMARPWQHPVTKKQKVSFAPATTSATSVSKLSDPDMLLPLIVSDPGLSVLQIVQDPSLDAPQRAHLALAHLVQCEEFYSQYWEQRPFHNVGTKSPQNFHDWGLSLTSIQAMSRLQQWIVGKDITLTRVIVEDTTKKNGKQQQQQQQQRVQQYEPHGTVVSDKVLWDHYHRNGASIRLLCPHQYFDQLRAVLSTLEWEFGAMVGANLYLTPPSVSQGFAPHYDDIEGFIVQIEGRKRWRIYEPFPMHLPRTSSNHDFQTVNLPPPYMDVWLETGQVLYIPRGWIHQAVTSETHHSLHVTLSVYQHWAWIDLLEMLVPDALEAVATIPDEVTVRQGLPRNFVEYMGVMHDSSSEETMPDALKSTTAHTHDDEEDDDEYDKSQRRIQVLRNEFQHQARQKLERVMEEAMSMLDAACDEMAKRFCSDRLPPALLASEQAATAKANANRVIDPTMLVRMVRPGISRMVIEDGKAVVYHCMDNSCVYHERALNPMEFEMDDAPAIEQLLTTVEPRWICVNDLFHDTVEDKVGVTQALYDEGILAVRP